MCARTHRHTHTKIQPAKKKKIAKPKKGGELRIAGNTEAEALVQVSNTSN